VTALDVDDGEVLEARDQRQSTEQERNEQTPRVTSDAPVQIETVMITSVNTTTAQSTVTTVQRRHRLTDTASNTLRALVEPARRALDERSTSSFVNVCNITPFK